MLRCTDCGAALKKERLGGRTPKYCEYCRKKRQEAYKNKKRSK